MTQQLIPYGITAPGFYGLNTQESSLDLAQGWALTAINCVIDQYGRIGARKGWTPNNTTSAALGTEDVKAIGELITADGSSWTICAGNNKLFKLVGSTLTELTYGGGGTAPTITASNWQMASLGGGIYLFQEGFDPLEFNPTTSTTQYRRVSEIAGYTGTVQKSNAVISAYGRLWNVGTTGDKVTVQWCNTKQPYNWSTGTAGTLDTTTVWPKGGDTIVGLGAHNGYLFIFGKNNILVYNGATDPSATTFALQDVITGIGCIGRDTIAYTGTDIIFLSQTGVRSVLRTIQEKSAPFRELSKNVRNDLLAYVASESTPANIKAVHSPIDAFYLLSFPTAKQVYCFDTKAELQDGAARVTIWDSINPVSFCTKQDGTLLLGKAGYVATYSTYLDNTSNYLLQYHTNHTDFGAPSVASILKTLLVTVIGGNGQNLTFKWSYDFTGQFYSQNVNIPANNIAYYGESEYNNSDYSNGQVLAILKAYPTGSGKVVQTGYEAYINGSPLSIQKIEIWAKNGKIT